MRESIKIANKKVLNFFDGSIIAGIVKEAAKGKSSGIALDLGSGNGRHAIFLAQKGFSVIALDNDTTAIAALKAIARKKKLSIKCVLGNIVSYCPKKKVDLVVAINSLHFLTDRQVPKVIKKIKEYTAAGGLHVIAGHTEKNPRGSRPHLFKKNELKEFYSDWKILEYTEKMGAPFVSLGDKKPVRKYKTEIIARKPK